jgi:glutamyl/glutaminyl-tRNA synthetase
MTPAALWLQLNADEAARAQSARRQILRAADLNAAARESDLIASDLAYAQLRSSGELERRKDHRALQEQVQREGTSS